jgi:nitroreductase
MNPTAEHSGTNAANGDGQHPAASTGIDIIENLHTRRSIRAFTNAPVERSIVLKIIELAQRAPSAANHQPWKVYVLEGAFKKRVSDVVKGERARDPSKEKSKTYFGEHQFYPEAMPPGYHER